MIRHLAPDLRLIRRCTPDSGGVRLSFVPDLCLFALLLAGACRYGYQWWIPGREDDANVVSDYLAIGIYGQFIYVNPEHRVVIAMNSACENPNKFNL